MMNDSYHLLEIDIFIKYAYVFVKSGNPFIQSGNALLS